MQYKTLSKRLRPLFVVTLALLAACNNRPPPAAVVVPPVATLAQAPADTPVVFVVAMENSDAVNIYGNTTDAPYLNNTLMQRYATASNFQDALPRDIPSEPHYLLMEAGSHTYPDVVFTGDGDPSARNSTATTAHLATQIRQAGRGLDWMSYQEGLTPAAGACPVQSAGSYATKHNPFVFFQDIAGSPPSKDEPYCAARHRDLGQLAADLAADRVTAYNFISPNACHNMHGGEGCADSNGVRAGDRWLQDKLPALIDYVNRHNGVIFLVWDESSRTDTMPFLAIGPRVRPGYASSVPFTHLALLRTVQTLLGLEILPAVAASNDLRDLFVPGTFR
jgi:hypothetical protein